MKLIIALLSITVVVLGSMVYSDNDRTDEPGTERESQSDQTVDGTQNDRSSSDSNANGRTVDLSGQGLTEFPKDLLDDNDIIVLDLSDNNLTGALPAEVRFLSELEELNVSGNNMTGIPAEIGQLQNLRILNYSDNQITGLPLELGNLTGLEVFDLSGNNPSQQDLDQIRAKLTGTEIRL